MLPVNHSSIHRRAIGVHVEDGKENADAAHFRFHYIRFIDFYDVGNGSVSRSENGVFVRRRNSVRITKKCERVKSKQQENQAQPRTNEPAGDDQHQKDRKYPACFS